MKISPSAQWSKWFVNFAAQSTRAYVTTSSWCCAILWFATRPESTLTYHPSPLPSGTVPCSSGGRLWHCWHVSCKRTTSSGKVLCSSMSWVLSLTQRWGTLRSSASFICSRWSTPPCSTSTLWSVFSSSTLTLDTKVSKDWSGKRREENFIFIYIIIVVVVVVVVIEQARCY